MGSFFGTAMGIWSHGERRDYANRLSIWRSPLISMAVLIGLHLVKSLQSGRRIYTYKKENRTVGCCRFINNHCGNLHWGTDYGKVFCFRLIKTA